MQCDICRAETGRWAYALHPDRLDYTWHSKSYVYKSELVLCDECREPWDSGDDVRVIDRYGDHGTRWQDQGEVTVAMLRGASTDARPQPYDDRFPAGTTQLRDEGFTPAEELTGLDEIAAFWPADHRRSLPESRQWRLDEGHSQFWALRSPSELHPTDYLNAIFSITERSPHPASHEDYLRRAEAAAALVFAMSPDKIKSIVPENPEDSP